MKSTQINLRLSNELFNMLQLKAHSSDKTVSEYIRELIATSEVKFNDKKNIGLLLGSINRIGNNINQIAHNLNIVNNQNLLDDIDYKDLLNQLIIIEHNLHDILKSV